MEKYKGSSTRTQMFQEGATAVDTLTGEEVQILRVIIPSKAGLCYAYKVKSKKYTYRAPEISLMRKSRIKTESKPTWNRNRR